MHRIEWAIFSLFGPAVELEVSIVLWIGGVSEALTRGEKVPERDATAST